VSETVPEEFLRLVDETIDITDTNPSTKMPELLLVIVPGSVGLDIPFSMELLVKLFEEYSLLKCPSRWLPDSIHIPSLCYNLVFDYSRVTDKGINAIAGHHRGRVTIIDRRSGVLLHFRAGGDNK
jgi:hypothetical protein